MLSGWGCCVQAMDCGESFESDATRLCRHRGLRMSNDMIGMPNLESPQVLPQWMPPLSMVRHWLFRSWQAPRQQRQLARPEINSACCGEVRSFNSGSAGWTISYTGLALRGLLFMIMNNLLQGIDILLELRHAMVSLEAQTCMILHVALSNHRPSGLLRSPKSRAYTAEWEAQFRCNCRLSPVHDQQGRENYQQIRKSNVPWLRLQIPGKPACESRPSSFVLRVIEEARVVDIISESTTSKVIGSRGSFAILPRITRTALMDRTAWDQEERKSLRLVAVHMSMDRGIHKAQAKQHACQSF